MKNIGEVRGKVVTVSGPHWEDGDAPSIVHITCRNGVITEIMFNWVYGVSFVNTGFTSKQAVDFANRKAREMGLSAPE